MPKKKTARLIGAAIVVAFLVLLLLYSLLPFVKGILASLILYVLFRPVHSFLHVRLRWNKRIAAICTLFAIVLVVLIPLALLVMAMWSEIGVVFSGLSKLPSLIREVPLSEIPGVQDGATHDMVVEMVQNGITRGAEFFRRVVIATFSGLAQFVINAVLAAFFLYYMFVQGNEAWAYFKSLVPFRGRNRDRLVGEFYTMTYSAVVSSGAIAVLQGALLGVGLWLAGVPAAVFLGFIGAICALLPMVGTPLVWGPATVILLAQGRIGAAIFLFIWGMVVSTIDNVIRPIINRNIGNIHPLVTLLGIFIGLPLFGIMGLIAGPLLLTYSFLVIQMFREEFLDSGDAPQRIEETARVGGKVRGRTQRVAS